MGLGYATLVAPASGAPCVIADDAGGMRLASVVLQASEVPAGVDSSLLRWGGDGSETDPSVLSDVFARVGGPGSLSVRANVMMEVAASNVILDNQSVLDTFTVMELSPLVQVGIRNACFACVDWSALLAWGLDGVNVNDVVTSVMQSEQSEQKSEEPEASAASDFDAENDAAESDDFESMANADKVREEDATEEPSLFSDDDKVPTDENADESASDPDRNESTTDPDDGPSDNSNEESKTITNGEEPSFF